MKRMWSILFFLSLGGWLIAQIPNVDSLQKAAIDAPDSSRVKIYLSLSNYYLRENLPKSIDYSTQAQKLARSIEDTLRTSYALSMLGAARYYQGNYYLALEAWNEALELRGQLGNKPEIAEMLNNIGVIYQTIGEYEKAIEYFQDNLKIQEEIGDTVNIAASMTNIGNIYYYMGLDYPKALNYYEDALELFKAIGQQNHVANLYNNIGLVYRELNDNGKALENYRKALKIFIELNDKAGIATSQSHIGNIYLEGENYQMALRFSRNALNTYREIGQKSEIASSLRDMGQIYHKQGAYKEALDYLKQSLNMYLEMEKKKEVFDIYKDISDVYRKMGDYQSSLEYYDKYVELKDTTLKEKYLKQISELETKYETEKKERENELLKTKTALQETELEAREAELKRSRILIFSFILGFVIISVFSVLLYRQYAAKKRANILLEEQNIEIRQQRDQIFQQKKEITDSIQYASRIQNALLPPSKELERRISDLFILYRPRDIVSGDYYWMNQKGEKTIIVAADCTGHGVPGAFMSMLGITFLNEIVNKDKLTSPDEILNKLRENVVDALHQTGQEGEAKDGMDIALSVIDMKQMQLEFAGAYNPLYLIRDDEIRVFKADKMPIGIHREKEASFTKHTIPIRKDDRLYMFSDGFVDQFGGSKGKKFMSKRFKEVILSIYKQPMKKQKEFLDKTLDDWRGNIEQIDDILVMGMHI